MAETSDLCAETTEFGPIARLDFDMDYPPGQTAAYLVHGSEPILVDAGAPGDEHRDQLVDGLLALGLMPADVEHVLITHPHTDHVGQVRTLLENDVTLYAPKMAVEQLERDPDDLASSVRETATCAGIPPSEIDEYVEKAVESLERDRELLPPEAVDVAFDVAEPFAVAEYDVTPIHTPGHQVSHTCFVTTVEGEDVLFAGDGLIEPFRAAALHVGVDRGAYESIDAFYDGLDRLAEHDVDRVFPGHGPVFERFDSVVEDTIGELDALVDAVETALTTVEPASPMEVAAERMDGDVHFPALLDTVGALGSLESRGRVSHECADGVRRYRSVE